MRIRISNPGPIKSSPDADQKSPKGSYVYAHTDDSGNYFYIGKGTGRRAWSTDRHPLWHRYVDKHLGGKFQVKILHDNLDNEEAEDLESEWIKHYSDTLINWVNLGRSFDFKANEKFLNLRNKNRELIAEAKLCEKSDLYQAVQKYRQVISNIQEYAFIQPNRGIVGQLIQEENKEKGIQGELEALDRLSICLVKLKKPQEAAGIAEEYFLKYRGDLQSPTANRIKKRIAKAIARHNFPK